MHKTTTADLVDLMRNMRLLNATKEEVRGMKEKLEGVVEDSELQKEKPSSQSIRKEKAEDVEEVPVRPIDKHMDVPLGVYVVLKATLIKNITEMYLRWDDETKACVPSLMDSKSLKNIRLVKKLWVELELGEYCIVHYEGDILNNTGWHRGQIERLPEKDLKTYKIHLIDIGCDEEVEAEDIFELPQEFYRKKRLCFQFGLQDYRQARSSEATFGVVEYLQKAFALYKTAVRVDTLATPASYPSTYTVHWGQIHCFSGEIQIIDYLVEKHFIALRNLGLVGHYTLRRFGKTAKSTYSRINEKATDSRHLTTIDGDQVFESTSLSMRKQEIEYLIDFNNAIGMTPYMPWLSGVGEGCLVMLCNMWVRGKVLFIEGDSAWITLLEYGENIKRPVSSLKEMPLRLRNIEPAVYRLKLNVVN